MQERYFAGAGFKKGEDGHMAEEYKRLNRELVYKGSIIDFYKDTVQVPDGNVVKLSLIHI